MEDEEEACRSFVQIWVKAVMRQVERVRALRKKAHSVGRAYERSFGTDEVDLARIAHEQSVTATRARPSYASCCWSAS